MNGKDVAFAENARAQRPKGIDVLANAVKGTFGPRGRNVLIERSIGPPAVTKDGVTVASEITLAVAAVRTPGFGDLRRDMLQESAVLTGGTVISEGAGLTGAKTTLEQWGGAKRVRVTKDNTTIIDGTGSKKDVAARVQMLRAMIEDTKSEYDGEKVDERVARLSGGIAVIKVGAATEVEMRERMARVDDALHATRAAVLEGIVHGGGVALLRVRKSIAAVPSVNEDQAAGLRILARAVEEPFRQIVRNGCGDPAVVRDTVSKRVGNFGYNAATEEYGDLIEFGVIDPAKVTRLAPQNAVSIAKLLLTTEVAVTSLDPSFVGAAR